MDRIENAFLDIKYDINDIDIYNINDDTILTGESLSLQSLKKLALSIGEYMDDKVKIISKFSKRVSVKLKDIITRLPDKDIELPEYKQSEYGKELSIYIAAGVPYRLPLNYHEFYLALLNILIIRIKKELNISIKIRGNGKLILDSNYHNVTSLIGDKVDIKGKIGKICYPIYIEDNVVKYATILDNTYKIVEGKLKDYIYDNTKIKKINGKEIKENIRLNNKYVSIGFKKNTSMKIIEVMKDIQTIIKDIEEDKIENSKKLLVYIEELKNILHIGDVILDFISTNIDLNTNLAIGLSNIYADIDVKDRAKRVNE